VISALLSSELFYELPQMDFHVNHQYKIIKDLLGTMPSYNESILTELIVDFLKIK